jgi:signal transduction histidine kinase
MACWQLATQTAMPVVRAWQLSAFNMQRLVNDVLDLAKLREGKLALQPVMVRVSQCDARWQEDHRHVYVAFALQPTARERCVAPRAMMIMLLPVSSSLTHTQALSFPTCLLAPLPVVLGKQSSVTRLVEELVEGYGSMAAPGVVVVAHVGPAVPPMVLLDPLRVKQVLSNGLTNALKNTPAGSVVLQVGMLCLRGVQGVAGGGDGCRTRCPVAVPLYCRWTPRPCPTVGLVS